MVTILRFLEGIIYRLQRQKSDSTLCLHKSGGLTLWRAQHEHKSGVETPRYANVGQDCGSTKCGTIRNYTFGDLITIWLRMIFIVIKDENKRLIVLLISISLAVEDLR